MTRPAPQMDRLADQLADRLSTPGIPGRAVAGASMTAADPPRPGNSGSLRLSKRGTPAGAPVQLEVNEPSPYRFDRAGNLVRGSHDFSTDLFAGMGERHDQAAHDRVLKFTQDHIFAVTTADVAG